MKNAKTMLGAEIEKLRFYEWAYGRLAESDSDIGPIGEFMVGRILGCLHKARKVNDLYDLIAKDGTSIEVKTTTKRARMRNGEELYRWSITDQRTALDGKRGLAQRWYFLIAGFPTSARRFNPLDAKWWRVYILTGEQVRSANVKRYLTESTMRRLGVSSVPLLSIAP
ncbi:MAG: hypothetical protein SOW92_00640 [Kiritimatiellia bacterium]|nr:hypothetical protein [Kiritimatiellia bacterium]